MKSILCGKYAVKQFLSRLIVCVMKSLTTYLRVLRSVRNFSQFGISMELGIRQSTYSRIENNPEKMTLKQLIILSGLYDLTPSELLELADAEPHRLPELMNLPKKTA